MSRWNMAAAILVILCIGGAGAYAGGAAAVLGGGLVLPEAPPGPPLTAARWLASSVDMTPRMPSAGYVLEVALFQSGERAARLVNELTAALYPAYHADVRLGPAGRRFVQVRVGPYATRTEAEAAVDAIRRMPGYADARIRPDSDE
jgi:hypothetical protein